MIREHDRVVLTAAIAAEGLEPGDVGAVVHVYPRNEAYEVEFVTLRACFKNAKIFYFNVIVQGI